MRRRDLMFLTGIALVVLGCFLVRNLLYRGNAVYVEIAQDGRVIETVPLDADDVRDIRVQAKDGGYNIVHIEKGAVAVSEADCAGGDCIRQGQIRRTGESIICLPHRLTILVKGSDGDGHEETQYDTIVR